MQSFLDLIIISTLSNFPDARNVIDAVSSEVVVSNWPYPEAIFFTLSIQVKRLAYI